MPPSRLAARPLTTAQRTTLAAAGDRLIPTDEYGPGAVAAGAVDYVVQALAGGDAVHLPAYVAGLHALDACAQRRHARGFAELDAAAQDAILADVERGVAGSGLDAEVAFFELLRRHVFEGMFGDPSYGGNRDRAGWELLGYTGPQPVWTEAEQRIDALPERAGPA
jgi:gluconate 2-dehydrogenase gamma chain